MSQPESKLSRQIMDELNRDKGVMVWKNHGGPHMMAGLPDIVGTAYGKFFSLEVKMPAQRANVSKVQQHVHRLIRAAGGYVAVVCSVAEARACLRECIGGHR